MVEPATCPDTGPRGTDFKRGNKKSKSNGRKAAVTNPTSATSNTSFKSFIRVILIQPTAPSKPVDAGLTCPECGAKISSKAGRLEKHRIKVHGADSGALPVSQCRPDLPVSAGTRPPGLHVCPVCGVLVKSLDKHAKRTGHGQNTTLYGKTVHRSKETRKVAPIIDLGCPKCMAIFPNATQLASHVLGTHGKRAFAALGYRARSRKIENPSESPTQFALDRSPNLDAKHSWGGSFRDNGQFGSYPSHDGMDDESFA